MTHSQDNHILVVDDEPAIRELLREFLMGEGYQVDTASNGQDALDLISVKVFDLVITDLAMPRMDGFQLINKALPLQPMLPFIVLSGGDTFENAIRAVHEGAFDFVAKPVRDFPTFKIAVDRGLEHKRLLVSQDNYQRNLESMVREQTKELAEKNLLLEQYTEQLESLSVQVITALMAALEEKDRYTAGHSRRVTHYAVGTARLLGVTEPDIGTLETAGHLHDMGKLMVDLSYVNKPGPLTPDEWEIMKQHPATADRFLAPLPFLTEVRPIIRHHHERLDGSGYPDGLCENEIDILTQILAVADSYDAMTSRRSYREPMSMSEALAELRRFSDLHYEGRIVETLVVFLMKDKDDPNSPIRPD
ncbi:MAG: response regulator [Proteobacteria bacterium]|nr:response regulator [Pseudomonadota bacterium]